MNKVKEFRDAVAQSFIKALSDPSISWHSGLRSLRPYNMGSNRYYRGINHLILHLRSIEKNYDDPRWLTFEQGKKNGYHLRKGEKGTAVEYWFPYDAKNKKWLSWQDIKEINQIEDKQKRDEILSGISLRHQIHHVFNAAQFDVIKPLEKHDSKIDDLCDKISKSMGVKIIYDQTDTPYYAPYKDQVHLPLPSHFVSSEDLNATAIHELAHASGHSSRLNRPLVGQFDDLEKYAIEELRAEIASAFMSVYVGGDSPTMIDNHKAYIQSWAKVIKDDTEVLIDAIKDAENITAYLEYHGGIISFDQYQNITSLSKEAIIKGKEAKVSFENSENVIQKQTDLNKDNQIAEVKITKPKKRLKLGGIK